MQRISVSAWCVKLAGKPTPAAQELALLSLDERERHASYLVAEPARQFATTRIALRRLLGQRIGCGAEAVPIVGDARGKPCVVGMPSLQFNVSHCASLAVIVLCDVASVGVDVEHESALDVDMAVTSGVCSPAELTWMQANRMAAHAVGTRLWTRKESAVKAAGAGLSDAALAIDFGLPDACHGVCVAPALGRVVWQDLQLPLGVVGAVAICSTTATGLDVTLRMYGSEGTSERKSSVGARHDFPMNQAAVRG